MNNTDNTDNINMFEIQAQTLEELLINYLKEIHGIVVSEETPIML